jgi:hypothetical protein
MVMHLLFVLALRMNDNLRYEVCDNVFEHLWGKIFFAQSCRCSMISSTSPKYHVRMVSSRDINVHSIFPSEYASWNPYINVLGVIHEAMDLFLR